MSIRSFILFRLFPIPAILLIAFTCVVSQQSRTLVACIYDAPTSIEQSRIFHSVYRGVAFSFDKGQSWINSGWLTNRTNDIAFDASSRTYFLATDYGVLRSTNDGVSWKLVTDWKISVALAVHVWQSAVWIATPFGPYVSRDNGTNWQQRTNGLNGLNATYTSDILARGDKLFLATADGLYTSEDNGITWVQGNIRNPIDKLIIHPTTGTMAAIHSSKRLWITTDNGETWSERSSALPDSPVQAITFFPDKPNDILISTGKHGVLMSKDLGASWENTSGGLTNFNVTALATDPDDPDTVYLGTENGTAISSDGGKTWRPFTIRLGYISAIRVF